MDKALLISLALAVAGMLTHQLKQFIQARADGGESFSAVSYWTKNWPQSALSVVGTSALVLIGYWQGALDPLAAYLSGIAGNTAAEVIGSRKSPS